MVRRRLLVNRPFALAWAGNLLSGIGDTFLDYTLLVLSVSVVGILTPGGVGVVLALPALTAGVWGSLADRHVRRRPELLLGLEAAACALLAVLAFTLGEVPSQLWQVLAYVLSFGVIAVGIGGYVVTMACLPEIVGSEQDDDLRPAVAKMTSQVGIASLAGPLLAAALAPFLDMRTLLALDAVSSAIATAMMIPAARRVRRHTRVAVGADSAPWNILGATVSGLKMVLGDRVLRVPMLANSVSALITYSIVFAIPIVVRERHLPSSYVGIGVAAGVLGSLLGTALAARLPVTRKPSLVLVAEPVVKAAVLVLFLLDEATPILLAVLVLFSLPQGVAMVARITLVTTRFGQESRGRAMGGYATFNRSLMPFGPLVSTAVIEGAGVRTAALGMLVVFCGLAAVLAADGLAARSPEVAVVAGGGGAP
jgi:MFS family permease